MGRAVLISIQPKWCKLIASGKKTVEVRKTKPKLDVPFKCYIYCTHNNRKYAQHLYINSGYGKREFGIVGHWRSGKDVVDVNSHLPAYRYDAHLAEGKVIGEFVCDRIYEIYQCHSGWVRENACLTKDEFFDYLGIPRGTHMGYDKKAYAWHISDLVIYDKPKELSDFYHACKQPNGTDCSKCHDKMEQTCWIFTRPPQSWCYVEE